MDQLPAQEWLHRIQRGDETALQALYDRHRTPFVAWALRHFRCTEADAIDIFQDSVIVLYRNIAQGRLTELTSSLKSYLYAIGRNLLLKHIRDHKAHLTTEGLPELEGLAITPSPSLTPLQARAKVAVQRLSEPCRSIVEMVYYRGFSMEVIKERLGYKNETVVRAQKKRCMQYLRKAMENPLDHA